MSIPKIKASVSNFEKIFKDSTWIFKLNLNNTKIHLGKFPSTLYHIGEDTEWSYKLCII